MHLWTNAINSLMKTNTHTAYIYMCSWIANCLYRLDIVVNVVHIHVYICVHVRERWREWACEPSQGPVSVRRPPRALPPLVRSASHPCTITQHSNDKVLHFYLFPVFPLRLSPFSAFHSFSLRVISSLRFYLCFVSTTCLHLSFSYLSLYLLCIFLFDHSSPSVFLSSSFFSFLYSSSSSSPYSLRSPDHLLFSASFLKPIFLVLFLSTPSIATIWLTANVRQFFPWSLAYDDKAIRILYTDRIKKKRKRKWDMGKKVRGEERKRGEKKEEEENSCDFGNTLWFPPKMRVVAVTGQKCAVTETSILARTVQETGLHCFEMLQARSALLHLSSRQLIRSRVEIEDSFLIVKLICRRNQRSSWFAEGNKGHNS